MKLKFAKNKILKILISKPYLIWKLEEEKRGMMGGEGVTRGRSHSLRARNY